MIYIQTGAKILTEFSYMLTWSKELPEIQFMPTVPKTVTGGSRLSWIFWEHENLSDLSIIQLIQLL